MPRHDGDGRSSAVGTNLGCPMELPALILYTQREPIMVASSKVFGTTSVSSLTEYIFDHWSRHRHIPKPTPLHQFDARYPSRTPRCVVISSGDGTAYYRWRSLRDEYSRCSYAPSRTALRCLLTSPLEQLGGAKAHGVGVAMVLQVATPRVHSQATLAAKDVRRRHLAELPQLETLPK